MESDFESILDPTNRRLLAELEADARISVAELGRRVGLSAPAVGERIGRL
jgi:Lrp/AsnC family leucine-responsive transcriptional regulator